MFVDPKNTQMPLYTNASIRELEKIIIDRKIATSRELMETAGTATLEALTQEWPGIKRIAIFCGKGNNGGDGCVLARIAHEKGIHATIYPIVELEDLKGLPKQVAEEAKKAGVEIKAFIPGFTKLNDMDVIVDALFGSGLKGDVVDDEFLAAIQLINSAIAPVVSIDMPSGLNPDTGNIHGQCVQAQMTVTLLAFKQGLFTNQAPTYCGKILCHTLNTPCELYQKIESSASFLNSDTLRDALPPRSRIAHKGHYGHVLIVGGDYGMAGAARMAAEAALRVGAGLVSVVTRPEHLTVINAGRPEIMCYSAEKPDDLTALIHKATVIVIGPGLGQSQWSKMLFKEMLHTPQPKVLDADALNLLAEDKHVIIGKVKPNWILTPHPGEAGHLLHSTTQNIQNDRFQSISKLREHYKGIIVLKGAGTLIKTKHKPPIICQGGNPGMATGGMGDILSGTIGGLLAQGLSEVDAAQVGVYVHSEAADEAVNEKGERGLLATDLYPYLHKLVNPYYAQDHHFHS